MNFIPCTIETIRAEGEDCWEISIPSVYASEAALEFAALHLNRREKIVFSDKTNCFTIFSDKTKELCITIRLTPPF